VWDAFLGDLYGLQLLVAAFATVVAAAVTSQRTLPDLAPALRRGWATVSRTPRRTGWRVARGAALAVVGLVIVVQPLNALRLVAVAGGLLVLYAGVDELLGAARDRRAARAEIGRRDLLASFAPAGVGPSRSASWCCSWRVARQPPPQCSAPRRATATRSSAPSG
jgi:hypothetical protein